MKKIKQISIFTSLLIFISLTFVLTSQAVDWGVETRNRVTSDNQYDRKPCLIQDRTGTFFAFFTSYTSGGTHNIRTSSSFDGIVWSNPVEVTHATSQTSGFLDPYAIQDQDGIYWLTYHKDDSGIWITYSTDGTDWMSPIQVTSYNRATDSWCRSPTLMQDRDGNYWLAYESSIHRSDIEIRKSTDGINWGPAIQVTPGTKNELEPSMIQDSNGRYWIVWSRVESDITSWVSSSNDGTNWSEPTQVSTGMTSYETTLIQNSDGNYIFAWRDDSTSSSNIWIAASGDCVNLDAPQQLTTGSSFGPDLIQGIYGPYYMVFSEKGNNDDVWMMTLSSGDFIVTQVSANVSVYPSDAYVGLEITLDASESSSENSSIRNYRWVFGDGNTALTTAPIVTHTYEAPNNYIVTLIVTNEYGNTDRTSTDVVVLKEKQDFDSPVTVDDYTDMWHTNDVTITLTASDAISGVAETLYRINEGTQKSVSTNGQPLIITEGSNNTLEYWSLDNAGNEETHNRITGIKLDKASPLSSINLNATIGKDGWFTSDVIVTVNATDVLSGADTIEYSLDNQVWDTYSSPVTIADEGNFSIYYRSTDIAGNVEHTKNETGKLDNSLPLGFIVINGNAAYVNSESVYLTLNASDSISGVAQMRFSNDGTQWSDWETYNMSKGWNLSSGSGNKTVFVQFKDNADLISSKYLDSIILDIDKPVADAGPDQTVTVGENITFNAKNSTDNTGIISYEWNFGDGTKGTGETVTHQYSETGKYAVMLTIQDNVGNTDTIQITVDVVLIKWDLLMQICVVAAAIIIVVALTVFVWRQKTKSSKSTG